MTNSYRGRVRRGLAILVVGGLALAGCGGDDSEVAGGGDEATTTTEVEVTETTEASTETTEATDTTLATETTLAGGTPTTTAGSGTIFTTTTRRQASNTTTTRRTGTTVKPGSGPTTTAGSSVNKGTIKLGTYGTSINSSTGAKTIEETRKVADAWARQVNAAGGVNGYKIEILYKDAAADNSRALQAVKELEAAGSLALVGQGDAARAPAFRDFVEQKKFPVLGGVPSAPEFMYHPMFFPVSASHYAGRYGQVTAARDVGAKHFRNVYCAEVAACAGSVEVTRQAADREGLKFSSQAASAVATDYTAVCLSSRSAGADFFQSNGLNFANVIRDCARQNYHPIYASGGAANQSVIDAAKGEQVAGNLFEIGVFYDGPEVKRFRQALATTDLLNPASPATQTAVQTWIAFEMAGAVINRLTQANPTRADFLNALYNTKGEDLGGMNPPIDYTVQRPGTGLHSNNDCWTQHLVKDGALYHMNKNGQIVNRATFICGTGYVYTLGKVVD